MNWRELKDFCNNLPELELEKEVILWRECESVTDIYAEQLSEDHYVNSEDSDDGCFPESEMNSQIEMSVSDYPNGKEHFKKVYDKGHPILHENF